MFSLIILNVFLITFSFQSCNSKGIIPPPPGTQCVSPNGQGLGPAIRELIDLLPGEKLIMIFIDAVSNDEEVLTVMEYLQSEEFTHIVNTMHNTPEFSNVMEYLCEELHFDAYYYLNSLGGILGYPPMTRPPPINKKSNNNYRTRRHIIQSLRSGFQGLLEDLRDALPLDELRRVYKERYENDEYLRLAMEKIGSDEFRRVGDAIENLPEYQIMLEKLRNIGVDVDRLLKALMDFFNWKPKEKLINISF